MRASRLVSLLLLLQTRGRLTAQELATELEVSRRTIYRDVDALQAAGVPLYGDAGHAGGYQLVQGYRTRLTGLNADESEALFLAGMPGPAGELGLSSVVAAAQLKLRAALPPELRDRSGRIQERFHLDAPGWYHDRDVAPYLASVADAVWGQRTIWVRYRSWTKLTPRVLEPYGLVLKAGRWYLVARAGEDIRTYRVNQILEFQDLGWPFERAEAFDLVAFWRAHVVEFRDRLVQGEAVIRLSPIGRERLPDLVAAPVAQAANDSASLPDARGWITATVPIESHTHAASQFLQLGADVEVLAPVELRDQLTATARGLGELYLGDHRNPRPVDPRHHDRRVIELDAGQVVRD